MAIKSKRNRDSRLVNIDRLKDEIAEKMPISLAAEQLLGLDLSPAGDQMKAACPFHAENTPSFYLSDAKGLYHCFGCGASGDTISLIQGLRHVEFLEALTILGTEADIEITKYERPMTAEEKRREELRSKCEYWIATLPADTSRAVFDVPGQMYPRQVTEQPDFLKSLPDYLFRGVLFPMRTPSGKLCGFKTRGRDKAMFATPKDWDLAEPTLYGIDVARQFIRERGEVILVEGEYDCLRMHSEGFPNTVAVSGSSFSDEQMEVLQGLHIRKAIFALDGDTGGKQGARKVSERWWTGNVRCFIAQLPEDKDPEDVLVSGSKGFFEMVGYLDEAKWALEYLLLDEWTERGSGLSDKLEYLEWVQETFGGQFNQTQEDIVQQHVAKWLQLPEARVLDFSRANTSKLQATDSEQIVIGACMRRREYYRQARKKLTTPDFYMIRHQRLWQVMEDLLAEDLDFEVVTIRQRGEAAGVDGEYVDQLLGASEGNLGYHEEQIKDLALRRVARESADQFRERIADLTIEAHDSIGQLTKGFTAKALADRRVQPINVLTDAAMDKVHERMRNPDAIHGFNMGSQFPRLMQRLQGFQKERFTLVAATSGVGKTTIAFQWAVNLAVNLAVPTDFVSLEMEETEMLFKAASHLTGVELEKITGGALDESEAGLVEQAFARIRKSPLRLYAPDDMTPSEFVLYARESQMVHHTEVFMLDYAQLISPEPTSQHLKTYEQLKEFGRVAKMQVARGMETAVIMPAQLAKIAKDKERPTKEDMGDCYDLARTADVVLILKDYEDSDTIDLWIDKNRQGPPAQLIPIEFSKGTQTFFEHGASQIPDYRLFAETP